MGTLTYLGTVLDPAALGTFIRQALEAAHVAPWFGPLPPEVEVARRTAADHAVFILINHGKSPCTIDLPRTLHDVLASDRDVRSVTLASQEVAILEDSHAR